MVCILRLMLLSSVFVLGYCKTVPKDEKTKLQNKIKEVKANITSEMKKAEHLKKNITDESKLLTDKLKISEELINNSSAENIKQHKEIEDLFKKWIKLKEEEKELKEDPKIIEKIKLEIQIMNENINIYKERREDNSTEECLELEGMSKNSSNSMLSLLALTKSEVEDTIVEQDELRLVKSQLLVAKFKTQELTSKLKSIKDDLKQYNATLNKLIKNLGEDTTKGQQAIDNLNKAIEEKHKSIADLKSKGTTKSDLDYWKNEYKKTYGKYKYTLHDYACYIKLYYEVRGFFPKIHLN